MLTGILLEFLLLLGLIALVVVLVFGFRRLGSIVNVILGRVERAIPPEERAQEYVRSARRHRDRLHERIAAVKANLRVLEDRLERFERLKNQWQRKAESLLDEENETEARYATARLLHYEELVDSYNQVLDRQRELLASLEQKLSRTELELDRTEQRAEFIRVTSDVARVNQTLVDIRRDFGQLGDVDTETKLEQLTEEVNRLQYRSEALAELKEQGREPDAGVSLEDDAVEARLQQLRDKKTREQPA